ncbi:MAG TPA: 16S rRNA (guanine(527)-N(7))-methyltransferase RsmG [Solirubrobacteraceae bacterium]|jgi:16S rRNA (guanine527-N7)-methyltransferase
MEALAPRIERRLTVLGEEYALAEPQIGALRVLLDLLAEDVAPTTVHDPARAVDVHIADALSGLSVESLREAKVVADLGSGAGVPALVLATALPHAHVFAVESVGRKGAFIERAAEAMSLANVTVVAARAEEWPGGVGRCDVVCARALAALPVVLEYAAPLLRMGGTVVAWKGRVGPDEAADGAAAAEVLGLGEAEVRRVEPFRGADDRTLHIYSKVMETPTRFPRRPGIATKRPLSAKK